MVELACGDMRRHVHATLCRRIGRNEGQIHHRLCAEVTERIADYIKAGVQHFMFEFLDYPSINSTKLLAEEVIPSLP